MPNGEKDHTRQHSIQCGHCKKSVTYWGPLANKTCPRCGLILWAGRPSDAQTDRIESTVKGCAAFAFFALVLLVFIAGCVRAMPG